MIGRLQGTLLRKSAPTLLLDVSGVGYEIEAPMPTFYELPAVGETVTLHIHLVVRDDAHLLYGFVHEGQRRLFRSLLKVNGVGPRVALAILSGLPDQELLRCIATEDVARLTRVPGIGRKTAERLVVELRDSLVTEPGATDPGAPAAVDSPPDAVGEAIQALQALGYKPNEALRAVRGIAADGLSSEDIIRQALQAIGTARA